jgi:hypothetical protein
MFALLPDQIMGGCQRRWQAKAAQALAGLQASALHLPERGV